MLSSINKGVDVDEFKLQKLRPKGSKEDFKYMLKQLRTLGSDFRNLDFIQNMLHSILEYDYNDDMRPIELLDCIVKEFGEDYKYSGTVYHGFNSMCSKYEILNYYRGLVSCTPKIDKAFNFGKNDKSIKSQYVLKFTNIKGFNMRDFIRDLYFMYGADIDLEFIKKYDSEYEILVLWEDYKDICITIDIKEISLEDVKILYGKR